MTIDGFPLDVNGIGVVGLVVLFFLSLMRGWVTVGPEMRRLEKDRDEWRSACLTKDAQLAEKDIQLRHLAEVGKTVEQLARGLQQEMDK